jgi:hypothetical protein
MKFSRRIAVYDAHDQAGAPRRGALVVDIRNTVLRSNRTASQSSSARPPILRRLSHRLQLQ